MTICGRSMSTPSPSPLSLTLPPRAATVNTPVSSPSSNGHDENNVPHSSISSGPWHTLPATSPTSLSPTPTGAAISGYKTSAAASVVEKKQRKLSETSTTNTSPTVNSSSVTTPAPLQAPWQLTTQQRPRSTPQEPSPRPAFITTDTKTPNSKGGVVSQENSNRVGSGSGSRGLASSPWSSASGSPAPRPASPLPPRVLGTSASKGNRNSQSDSSSGSGNGNGRSGTSASSGRGTAPGPNTSQLTGLMRETVASPEPRQALAPRSNTSGQDVNSNNSSHSKNDLNIKAPSKVSGDKQPIPPPPTTGTPPLRTRSGTAPVPGTAPLIPAANSPVLPKAKTVSAVSPNRGSSASNAHTHTTGTSLTSSPSVRASLLPKNPKDVPSSPKLRARSYAPTLKDTMNSSPATAPAPQVASLLTPLAPDAPSFLMEWPGQGNGRHDPDDQEQALFEQRLCEDSLGVAVRKINQNGKSNLRYVRCIYVNTSELEVDQNSGSVMGTSSTRSVSSRSRGAFSRMLSDKGEKPTNPNTSGNPYYNAIDSSEPSLLNGASSSDRKTWVLTWGKKKDVRIPLERFVCVRKGKLTDRTRRNTNPASRILSLLTDDPRHASLDIEAPTRLDRDKFAKAFARFLNIPLEGDDARTVRSADINGLSRDGRHTAQSGVRPSAAHSVPDIKEITKRPKPQKSKSARINSPTAPVPQISTATSKEAIVRPTDTMNVDTLQRNSASGIGNAETPNQSNKIVPFSSPLDQTLSRNVSKSSARRSSTKKDKSREHRDAAEDEESDVSSLTGAGFDQEIVEELHHALNELRTELEESRAEAARAVKVAEQAIQSAENSSSKDWNSTVTHKAAEAAALAQKRSAEAMAKQRLAEERLEGERRNAAYWRKQAELAEEQSGALQTRAAAAEVQRAAMAETLDSERRKSTHLVSHLQQQLSTCAAPAEDTSIVADTVSPPSELSSVRQKAALIEKASKLAASSSTPNGVTSEILRVHAEYQNVRNQFELLRKSTSESLEKFPSEVKVWAESASRAVLSSKSEADRLRVKLARESATRRKLLHEVQDLRGAVRVYCRPREPTGPSVISMPSNELLLLHREKAISGDSGDMKGNTPISFEFDGIFASDMNQKAVYEELEDVCLGVLDGFNVCVMTYGQKGSGKSHTLFGDVTSDGGVDGNGSVSIENYGLQMQAASQLFSVTSHRGDRYQDTISCTIVEVHDERLCDLIAGTSMGDARGKIVSDDMKSSRKSKTKKGSDLEAPTPVAADASKKLEIKTNFNGETIVQGCLSVEVSSFEELLQLWSECLRNRAKRLTEQGIDIAEYESKSHTISTFKVVSKNLSTKMAVGGKIQFVDLACSDVVPRRQSSSKKQSAQDAMLAGVVNSREWKFTNKSLTTMSEVVHARSQFARSVPYRNSTLTHLLSDSLESDTKVVLIACIHSDLEHIQDTACTLRFANKMRKIIIGKATKHTMV